MKQGQNGVLLLLTPSIVLCSDWASRNLIGVWCFRSRAYLRECCFYIAAIYRTGYLLEREHEQRQIGIVFQIAKQLSGKRTTSTLKYVETFLIRRHSDTS